MPLTINQSGSYLEVPSQIIYHSGNGTNPDRQAGPHPHSIVLDRKGTHVFVPDLGLDQTYQYDYNRGVLTNNTVPWVYAGKAGDGPRHLAWHPNYQFAYVVNEILGIVDVFNYNEGTGVLSGPIQSISTLPTNFTGDNRAAEIYTTPNGMFLYASNRGYDSIVGYRIDTSSQAKHLTLLGWTTYLVDFPRTFAIDPLGNLLLVGSANSNEVVSFFIKGNGDLVFTGAVTRVPNPICIQIVEITATAIATTATATTATTPETPATTPETPTTAATAATTIIVKESVEATTSIRKVEGSTVPRFQQPRLAVM